MQVMDIARICHEANRAFCQANGDNSQRPWNDAEEWQRESAVSSVQFRLDNPAAEPGAQHVAWMNQKLDAGWKYSPVKNGTAKEHPSLVPFDQLPLFEQLKDSLFMSVVDALKRGLAV